MKDTQPVKIKVLQITGDRDNMFRLVVQRPSGKRVQQWFPRQIIQQFEEVDNKLIITIEKRYASERLLL